jgi:14-3-3 protein epsilon
MLNCISKLSSLNFDISSEYIELFTRCFKNIVGVKRGQLRKIEALIEKEIESDDNYNEVTTNKLQLLNLLKNKHSLIITNLCNHIIQLSKNFMEKVLKVNKSKRNKLYFQKTIADHYRYIYELIKDEEFKYITKEAYSEALFIAENEKFPSTDMTYLTFYLNYCVYLHDVLEDRNEAIKVAKSILHSTLKDTDEITDTSQKDVILLCQMIKDNLSLWKNEMPEEMK